MQNDQNGARSNEMFPGNASACTETVKCGHCFDSPQWCVLHGCRQDDPNHEYDYHTCETKLIELGCRFCQNQAYEESKMSDAQLLAMFMCHISMMEAEAIMGPSGAQMEEFIGVSPGEFEYSKHFYLAVAKAKRIMAQALLEEYKKGIA